MNKVRKRLTIAGLIMMLLGGGGWLIFMNIPNTVTTMSPEEALGLLIMLPIITGIAMILGIAGLITLIFGLVLKKKNASLSRKDVEQID